MRHFGFALAVVAVLLAAVAEAADTSYHLRKEIAVGGEGGWDYLDCGLRRSSSVRGPRDEGGRD